MGAVLAAFRSPLAARGFHVTGIDLSLPMLRQAQRKRRDATPAVRGRLTYRQGDMAAIALAERFDAVICPFFGLAHVETSAWPAVFMSASSHMARGGVFAIHLPLTEKMAVPSPPPFMPVFRRPIGGGDLTLFVIDQRFDRAAGRFDLTLDYEETSAQGRKRRREKLTYFLNDPDPVAIGAGLRVASPPALLGETGRIHVYRRDD